MRLYLTLLLILFVNGVFSKVPTVVQVNRQPISLFAHPGDELVFISADNQRHELLFKSGDNSFRVIVDKNKNEKVNLSQLEEYEITDLSFENQVKGALKVRDHGSRKSVKSTEQWYSNDAKAQKSKFENQNLAEEAAKPKEDVKDANAAKPKQDVKDANAAKPKQDVKDANAAKPKQDAKAPKQDANAAKPKAKEIDNEAKEETKADTKSNAAKENNEGNSGTMLTINALIVVASLCSALLI
ncbi:expressed protein [Dictyostelium purpureum]|uniref:Expressed protein n=1 Tax=Dictyostelium purpureum TaxID=5786 RepID=F0ZEB1_DICPU|nr:uncharacterized protein DICPUDRAFT_91574 [Dictyostelium purpureum]EGC37740.1 expressed protein [Dictyostelium purpureum]|eukprot:XP_003285761.1 expressed protein [Dictyostelium purpureum]